MAFSDNGKKTLFTEINITPLTDIFLVLLIIMMVIAPSFQSIDTDINIPEINSGTAVEQKNAEISVTKQGRYYLNGRPITAESLTDELISLKLTLEKPEVVVKADTQTKSSEIQKIMKAAQEAQYAKLVLAGEPLSKKEQRKLEQNASQNQIKQQTSPSVKKANAQSDYDWNE